MEVGIFYDTVALFVTKREHGRMLVVGVRNREVVALRKSRARDGIKPVGVGIAHSAVGVDIPVITPAHSVIHILARGRVPHRDWSAADGIEVEPVIAGVCHRVNSVVERGLRHCSGIARAIEQLHLRLAAIERCRQVGVEIHLDFVTLLATLGGDDDNAV